MLVSLYLPLDLLLLRIEDTIDCPSPPKGVPRFDPTCALQKDKNTFKEEKPFIFVSGLDPLPNEFSNAVQVVFVDRGLFHGHLVQGLGEFEGFSLLA